jgi:5'-phosphate synthase pdxT subunit
MKIGVLAVQGDFIEHINILKSLNVEAITVRLPAELANLNGLIIPGGESTSILRLMHDFKLIQPLQKLIRDGLPVWGTCAGLICLAKRVSTNGLVTMGLMDISVKRNAFGRQIDSFETELSIPVLGERPYHAVFIRAPVIESIGKSVEVLAKLDNNMPVAARQNCMLVTAFHPELTDDLRFHRYFLKIAAEKI